MRFLREFMTFVILIQKKLLYLGRAPDHLRPVKDRYWLISTPPSRRESASFECQQATLDVLFVG